MRLTIIGTALMIAVVTPSMADDLLHQSRAASSSNETAQPTRMQPGQRPQTGMTMDGQLMQDRRQGTGIGMTMERSVAGCMQLGQMPEDRMTMGRFQHDGDVDPATQTLRAASAVMDEKVDVTFSGETDVDFIKIMLPREMASLDMVRAVVGFVRDPEVRKLAEDIIKAKEENLAQMQDWLKKRGR